MQNPPVFNATDAAIFLFPGKKIRPSLMGRSQKALFYGIFTLAPNGYLVSITLLLSLKMSAGTTFCGIPAIAVLGFSPLSKP